MNALLRYQAAYEEHRRRCLRFSIVRNRSRVKYRRVCSAVSDRRRPKSRNPLSCFTLEKASQKDGTVCLDRLYQSIRPFDQVGVVQVQYKLGTHAVNQWLNGGSELRAVVYPQRVSPTQLRQRSRKKPSQQSRAYWLP